MQRRTFVKTSLAGVGAITFCSTALQAKPTEQGWLNGFKDRKGRYGVAEIAPDLSVKPLFYAPVRLHGLALSPNRGDVVAPARRPGTTLFVFDLAKQAVRLIEAAQGRHFYGHAVFSNDGKRLFTTESAFDEERGVIGIYDVQNGYRRLGEWDSGGIGPHEMHLFKDKLVIANGGILTHPATGRAKLNIDTMEPNLTLMDISDGQQVVQYRLSSDLHQLSIRHLDVNEGGTIFIGLQDQLTNRRDLPLVWHLLDDELKPLTEPQQGWRLFNGYVGSVCASPQGVCVSSPRGNVVHGWSATAQMTQHQQDVCGLARMGKGSFLLTSGQGVIRDSKGRQVRYDMQFDNHCAVF